MKKVLEVLVLGLFAVLAFSMWAHADNEVCCQGMKMGMHEQMMGSMHERMEKGVGFEEVFSHKAKLITGNAIELGLSDNQLEKIKTLKLSMKKSMIKSSAEIELLDLDIEEALGKEEIDVNNTNSLLDKKYSIKLQEAKTFVGAYAELKNILSKDQMKKLHDIWNKQKMEKGKPMMMEGKEKSEHKMGMPKEM